MGAAIPFLRGISESALRGEGRLISYTLPKARARPINSNRPNQRDGLRDFLRRDSSRRITPWTKDAAMAAIACFSDTTQRSSESQS